MLANPHWDAPSMSSFESWLEGRDPKESYKYSDCLNCACAQYLKHVGQYHDRWLAHTGPGEVVHNMNRLAAGNLWGGEDDNRGHTFGELLGRVRAHRQLVLT